MIAKQVIYAGRVQGVGFRFSVREIAAGFEVTGSVRNLPDGRVELQACARDEAELEEFLATIQDSHLASFIKSCEETEIPPLTGARGFSIVRD
jgi:acylphosphatase